MLQTRGVAKLADSLLSRGTFCDAAFSDGMSIGALADWKICTSLRTAENALAHNARRRHLLAGDRDVRPDTDRVHTDADHVPKGTISFMCTAISPSTGR